MDMEQYDGKIKDILQPPTYKRINRDRTSKTTKRVTGTLKSLLVKHNITPTLFDKLKPRDSRAPRFYGLPKIHKPETPLRPIVSAIGSPTYQLAKYVTSLISPLSGNFDTFVQNSKHFSEILSTETIHEDEIMVSFDVKSLFTNVPGDTALEVI